MKIRFSHGLILCVIGILLLSVNRGTGQDLSTPRAALETLLQGIRTKDKDLCLYCVVSELRKDVAEEWDESEMPDEFEFRIIDEDIDETVACMTIELWEDEDESGDVETIWFIKDNDEWRITIYPPDEMPDEHDTCLP